MSHYNYENKPGFWVGTLQNVAMCVAVLLIVIGAAAGGMVYGEHKQSPRTTPGPSTPSDVHAIANTIVSCNYCFDHEGLASYSPVYTDGMTRCTVCNRAGLVDVTMPGKLAVLSPSGRKLVADATSKVTGSNAGLMKVGPVVDKVVDLDGAGGLHLKVNGGEVAPSTWADLSKLDILKLPADVQACLAYAQKDLTDDAKGLKALYEYDPGKKGHIKSVISVGNKECTAYIYFWPN